jgi:hypothetical protein
MARGAPGTLSVASRWRLLIRPSWHLCAHDTIGDTHCQVVLPGRTPNFQPIARFSRGKTAWAACHNRRCRRKDAAHA